MTGTVVCPDCEDWTTHTPCRACANTGQVSADYAAWCDRCGERTVWLGQHCGEHIATCDDCRPDCADCADDGDSDPYYAGRRPQ